jgi:hypothetical protein
VGCSRANCSSPILTTAHPGPSLSPPKSLKT